MAPNGFGHSYGAGSYGSGLGQTITEITEEKFEEGIRQAGPGSPAYQNLVETIEHKAATDPEFRTKLEEKIASEKWYRQPWVMIAGAALAGFTLVAIFSR